MVHPVGVDLTDHLAGGTPSETFIPSLQLLSMRLQSPLSRIRAGCQLPKTFSGICGAPLP